MALELEDDWGGRVVKDKDGACECLGLIVHWRGMSLKGRHQAMEYHGESGTARRQGSFQQDAFAPVVESR